MPRPEFIQAVFAKVGELRARFGNAAPPGEGIPHVVVTQIDTELRDFLRPYARQICDNTLVLPGISEQVQEQLSFRWWYPLVPPYFFGWLFNRKSICTDRVVDEASRVLPSACEIALGHSETWYTSQRPSTFRSYSDAEADSIAYLMGSGRPVRHRLADLQRARERRCACTTDLTASSIDPAEGLEPPAGRDGGRMLAPPSPGSRDGGHLGGVSDPLIDDDSDRLRRLEGRRLEARLPCSRGHVAAAEALCCGRDADEAGVVEEVAEPASDVRIAAVAEQPQDLLPSLQGGIVGEAQGTAPIGVGDADDRARLA